MVIGDQRQRGFVLDVSPSGLFVQSVKTIPPGQEIQVEFTPPELGAKIELRAWIARSCQVPANLVSLAAPGVGLRITHAPPEYQAFLSDLGAWSAKTSDRRKNPATAGAPSSAAQTRLPDSPPRPPRAVSEILYRVQAKHKSGPRSRSIVLSAASRESAEAQVLEELGDDWHVIQVETA